jgi:hypothetical protein
MLTTTLDGLWALQAIAGIEQLCPELGLRPLLPRLDTREQALRHPVAATLIECGALDAEGEVDPMIREWLTVIMRRDLTLLLQIGVGDPDPAQLSKASICRFAQWWVVLERCEDQVRLYSVGVASDEASASDLVVGQIERLCGVAEAASMRPVTLRTQELLERVRDATSLRKYLVDQRLDVDQLQIVMMAADPAVSALANLVAIQVGGGPSEMARLVIGDTTVLIADTPAGRVCVENVDNAGRRFQVVAPGSRQDIAKAITRLLRRLPAGEDWYSYRRVV